VVDGGLLEKSEVDGVNDGWKMLELGFGKVAWACVLKRPPEPDVEEKLLFGKMLVDDDEMPGKLEEAGVVVDPKSGLFGTKD